MQTRHGEISCSHQNIHRHGKRRKRCNDCGKTWTLWKRRRGRKRRPRRTKRLERTFKDKLTLIQQAKRAKTNPATFNARHRQILDASRTQPWQIYLPEYGDLIFVVDGKWYTFENEKWTLYLMAVRPVKANHAVFLPPMLLPGKESLTGWQRTIETIPKFVQTRIKAIVSDSFRGVETIVKENNWIQQRCHFHLHASFQCMVGHNKSVSFRKGRQQIYQSVRTFLVTTNARTLYKVRDAIARCAVNRACPVRLRRKLKELLRREDEFRAYLLHPDLRLPATSNIMESMNAQLDDLEGRCHGFRSPKTLIHWATAHIRHNSTMNCHPKNLQN